MKAEHAPSLVLGRNSLLMSGLKNGDFPGKGYKKQYVQWLADMNGHGVSTEV